MFMWDKRICEFYSKLEDEESRFIFMSRVQYLISGDDYYLTKMVYDTNKRFHPVKRILSLEDLSRDPQKRKSKVVLYGAGKYAKECLKRVQEHALDVIAFCDSNQNKQGQTYLGLPIISPVSLTKPSYYNCNIVVSTPTYEQEICDTLLAKGLSADRLFLTDKRYSSSNYPYQEQYFGPDFINPELNEIYVDAGCYTGDTIQRFTQFCGPKGYRKIYGFEPHPDNFKIAETNIEKWGIESVTITNESVWDSETELSFLLEYGTGPEGARISDEGTYKVRTTTIDLAVNEEKVTFIKMDVEGAELKALKGAENTIRNNKPKLAICVYHKVEDIVEIPLYLLEIQPEYKFYLRHHNYITPNKDKALDTVLYAI